LVPSRRERNLRKVIIPRRIQHVAKIEKTRTELKGWQAIAGFLGQPVAIVQRWARESGMPVSRQGRYVMALPEELNRWLGRESGDPVQIATATNDLAADLQRGLSYIRQQRSHKSDRTKGKPR
jgi:hypothetical protein